MVAAPKTGSGGVKAGAGASDVGAIVVGFAKAFEALSTAKAQKAAIKAQAAVEQAGLEANARFASIQAQDSIDRGEKAAKNRLDRTSKMLGAQKVALAAQGIELTGSAVDVLEETGREGRLDARTIRANAFRESLGFKAESINLRARARTVGLSARFKQRQTVIAGRARAGRDIAQGIEKAGESAKKFLTFAGS